jgi:CHAD domain-containing protein
MLKKLQQYAGTQLKNIRHLLACPAKEYSEDSFHQLRVRIKKLNALIILLRDHFEDFRAKKMMKPFKRLFDAAGEIRELQIEKAVLQTYFLNGQLDGLRSVLQDGEQKAVENFQYLLDSTDKSLVKTLEKYLGSFLEEVKKDQVQLYVGKHVGELNVLFRKGVFETEIIHDIRKRLKALMYILEAIESSWGNELLATIKWLCERLGAWHDSRVMVSLLEHAEQEHFSSTEQELITKLKQEFEFKSETLLSSIFRTQLIE